MQEGYFYLVIVSSIDWSSFSGNVDIFKIRISQVIIESILEDIGLIQADKRNVFCAVSAKEKN